MIYLDSSSLLKLLLEEPESHAVRLSVAREADVVVSTLTELESLVQLQAGWLAGEYRERRYRAYVARLDAFRDTDPFHFASLSGTVFATAIRQHRGDRRLHCRSLDRLHLAAMEELELRRLMTNDLTQGTAATALGYEVLIPGRA